MAWKVHFIFCLIIIVIDAYKYPIKKPSWTLPSGIELLQENQKPHLYDDKTISKHTKSYETTDASGNLENSQEIFDHTNKIFRHKNAQSIHDSQVDLQDIWKIIRTDQIHNNKIVALKSKFNSYEVTDQLKIPDHCKQSTYCEDIPNYPHDAINKLIEELGDKVNWLPFENVESADSLEIDLRVGAAPENSKELCNSRIKKIYPLAAAGPYGKWYTVINRKDNPVQAFKGEICESDGSDCSDIIYSQRKYTVNTTERTVLGTSCIQKYVPRTAAVVEIVGNKLEMVEKVIDIPSCCSCVARLAKTENNIS